MRFVRRPSVWIAALLLGGLLACATDTELNPQPLPPDERGGTTGGPPSKNGESDQSPTPGSSGATAPQDAGSSSDTGTDADSAIGDGGEQG